MLLNNGCISLYANLAALLISRRKEWSQRFSIYLILFMFNVFMKLGLLSVCNMMLQLLFVVQVMVFIMVLGNLKGKNAKKLN